MKSLKNLLVRSSHSFFIALLFFGVAHACGGKAMAKTIQLESGLATPVLRSGQDQKAFVRVALTGFEMDSSVERPPLNVSIVLDQSTSMGGEKIERAKEAARLAVGKLAENDIISIVTYDSSVKVLIPATMVGKDKAELYAAIDRVRSQGSTALFAGTSKGAAEVRKFLKQGQVNRVVLLSDGMANTGPSTPSELGQLGKALAKEGMSVSTIGLGLGYDEDLMTQLANYSDGNHDFVENFADLARVFDREFGDAMSVVAQNVDIEIICDEGIKPLRIVGRDGEIVGNRVQTRINQLYSSQKNYVVLEVLIPAEKAGAQRAVAEVKVNYDNVVSSKFDRLNGLVAATFSNSEEKVKKAIDKVAYEDVIEQVANENSQQALKQRDEGNIAAAKSTLTTNASFLDRAASLISSTKLREQSVESKHEAEVVEDDKMWNRNRKGLKEKTYKRSKQQKYTKGS